MPGINANLSNAAFALWEEVPKKGRKSPLGGVGEPGRSKWLSGVIIDHHQEMKRFKVEIQVCHLEKLDLMKRLTMMAVERDNLQEIVNWSVRQPDGPKS